MNMTRFLTFFFVTLLIAFFANLYIVSVINEFLFIMLIIISTISSYVFCFKFSLLKSNYQLKYKTTFIYLCTEAIIVTIMIIWIYFYIKSIYI